MRILILLLVIISLFDNIFCQVVPEVDLKFDESKIDTLKLIIRWDVANTNDTLNQYMLVFEQMETGLFSNNYKKYIVDKGSFFY